LLILLAVALPEASFSQKKRKTDDDGTRGIRLRESEFYFTEGEKYFILEDYSKALVYYQRAIESNPDNGTIHYKIAEVLAKSNKQEDLIKASISIERALELDRTNKYFYVAAANIYNSLGKFDKTTEAYERMLRDVKGSEEYLYELAAVYQYADKTDEAIKTYDRAESVFGLNEISSIQKIRLYFENGKQKEAIAEGEKLIKAFPEEEKYVMAFTEVLSQKGLQQESVKYLEKFVSANPDAGEAAMLLAGFYRDTNQEQKARPLLTTLFDSEEVQISSKLIILGAYIAELNNGKMKGVADSDKETFVSGLFEKLSTKHPESPEVHIIGGDFYLSTNKLRDAQREYLFATEAGDVQFEVWENLLLIENQLEQFDSVLKHAEQALELFPNQARIHYLNGFANFRKRNYDEAIASFEHAKKMSSSKPDFVGELNGLLGDAYNAVKQYEKSDRAYDEALTFNANNSVVLNNYSYHLAMRKENLDKAEKMSALLVKNHPDNPTFLDTHAWVLYVKQKYKDARKVIEKAISTGKANASHFEHYGDILYQLGEVDAAVTQWEKARGLNAKSETLNKKIANRKIYE
jgi:tetratricopeptide (TPR) repeat protein